MPASISRSKYVTAAVEPGLQHRDQVDAEVRSPVDRLAPHQPDEVVVVGEEPEPGVEHELDLRPPDLRRVDGVGEPGEPVRQRAFEDLSVEGLLRVEVVQQARPPDPDAGGDVVERRAVVAGMREAGQRLVEDLVARRSLIVDQRLLSKGLPSHCPTLSPEPLPTDQ